MMAVGMAGPFELIIILALSGGVGLPLGIPPAPEDALLARAAPEQCLSYTTWSGMAKPDPNSTNQTEQLLAEPEIQRLIAQIEQQIKTLVQEQNARSDPQAVAVVEDAVKWAKVLLTSPTALFVESVTPLPVPTAKAGALVRVGDEAAAELKATLERYQQMIPQDAVETIDIGGDQWYRIQLDPKVPPITWGVKGKYFIVGLGEGSAEGILARARTEAPQWLTDVRDQLPVERMSTVTYVNLQTIIKTLAPMGGPMVQRVLDASGLANVTSLASVTGLDGEGYLGRSLIAFDGEPGGVLAALTNGSLAPEDLEPIPSDATVALAARLDLSAVLEAVLSAAEVVEPRASAEILEGLQELHDELGIDVRGDVLGSLGDTWRIYNSPSEGGLVITGLTAVVQVEDAPRLAAVHAKLIAMAKKEFRQDADDASSRSPRIEQFEFQDREIYFFNARDNDFPVAPAWCLTDDQLIVAPFPQNIKSYLLRDSDHESLATVPEVAELFTPEGGPIAMAYCDTAKLFELIYPLVPMAAQAIMSELQREGIDVNVSILPSATAIGKHLRPGVMTVRRNGTGIELTNRQTIPGGNIGTTVPMAMGLLLPAVGSARGAARRATSMNKMKQIAIAMHVHHEAHGQFPPAYSTDENGKPLLSWRVHILPFIEERGLYEQFHLDEPWDSDHNKTLIPLMPQDYKRPGGNAGPGMTNYLTVRGEKTVFPGKEKVSISDITDGSSNTIMAVEVADYAAVTWTSPEDYEYDEDFPASDLLGTRPEGFIAAYCDGSVRLIGNGGDSDWLKAHFTRNGGEVVDSMPGRRQTTPPRTFETREEPMDRRPEKAAIEVAE